MAERLRFHPPGRRCELGSCITVLNHFNPGPLCLMHQEEARGIPLLDFGHAGMNELWVRIQLTRKRTLATSARGAAAKERAGMGRTR